MEDESNIHPLLRKKAEEPEENAAPDQAEDTPVSDAPIDSGSPETPAGEVAPEAVAEATQPDPAPVPDEPDPYIKIDRKNFSRELRELIDKDKDLGNQLHSFMGRRAKREYEPQIAEKNARIAELEAQMFKRDSDSLTAEELAERLRTDRAFAERYHAQPADTQAEIQRTRLAGIIDDAFAAVEDDLPPQRIEDYRRGLANGWFDYERDGNGNPGRPLSYDQALARFQTSLHREAAEARADNRVKAERATVAIASVAQPVAVAPEPAPKAQPNTRLATAAPDLSPTSSGSRGAAKVGSMEEWRRLNPVERKKLYPDLDEFAEHLNSGLIKR